ncbi:murein L,D-transpeptidase catalytic domain family protein [Pseudoluteimonas lycopersici]|uniref:Murein L,D-transpeptidase catalytic domain family protein n=1 Tax=Pseudoluteimonas lycopersici TaxID=1324796 RepID=A0A516V690_9GAMM|nr:murein L,D-transpeptidase catalytic domain family protein [Lysobacter lycopersici]QDQ74001.1 murein L,D-transpeptidase catalytic domain family protein [Lysobacter lycopersici]
MRPFHFAFTLVAALAVGGCSGPQPRPSIARATTVPAPRPAPQDATLAQLQRLAPEADPGVLALALAARDCAVAAREVDAASKLAVIDYSLPSTQRRLWVFDLAGNRLLQREYVAHGQGSGENLATRFSNNDGSHATSLGLYRTAETYDGDNGYSLRMDGLDPGFNDNARSRAIVMHGAWYVDPDLAARQGRIGRSHGCPALRQQVARVVIDELKDRQLLFAYADDAQWLHNARSFACDGRNARQILAAARSVHVLGGSGVVTAAP